MDKQLLTETLKTKNTVTFFYADWCGGCKVARPMVQEIAGKLGFEIISINEDADLETAFSVDYYPHVILSYKGKIKHYPGIHPIKELYESII
jgi:thiol-disulfide isomerase/thioredoxin